MNRLKQSIPNIITLCRPALACAFVALLPGRFCGGDCRIPALAVFALICLSDFLDGRLARALGAVSERGAVLDLFSDFFYIALSLIMLNILKQAPVWFTAVVLVKFIEYILTSRILRRDREGVFIPDSFGRIAAGLFFIVPGIACALYGVQDRGVVFCGVLYLAAALALVSSVIRCMSCVRACKRGVLRSISAAGKSEADIAAQK